MTSDTLISSHGNAPDISIAWWIHYVNHADILKYQTNMMFNEIVRTVVSCLYYPIDIMPVMPYLQEPGNSFRSWELELKAQSWTFKVASCSLETFEWISLCFRSCWKQFWMPARARIACGPWRAPASWFQVWRSTMESGRTALKNLQHHSTSLH